MSNDLTETCKTHSYNVCLYRMKKAFEHCSIVLIPGLGVSLPFRQALGVIYRLIICDYDVLTILTCEGDVATRGEIEPNEHP